MKDPQNIACFKEATAGLLALLYEHFPVCIEIDTDAVADQFESSHLSRECVEWLSTSLLIDECLHFLADEGFVRYRSRTVSGRDAFYTSVRLTSKGFTALDQPETIISNGRTEKSIGSSLVTLTKKGVGTTTTSAIKEAVAHIFS